MTLLKSFTETEELKSDLFGRILRGSIEGRPVVVRDASTSAWWLRWLARRLLRREVNALRALDDSGHAPRLLCADRDRATREFVEGMPLYEARIADPAFYAAAMRALRTMHRHNVAHSDLAKEPNILVTPDQTPVFIDFQLATVAPRRGRLFRLLAREDIRHLLKHKRSYCPASLTSREQRIVDTPSVPSLWIARTVKPVYQFITRRVLGWADREGAKDRGRS